MRQIILVIHIFLAIIWVGGIMFVGWGVFPATLKFSFAEQRKFLLEIMKWAHHLFTLAGAGVIITGILLGTFIGPIKSIDFLLHSSYGRTWSIALILGIFTLLWGIFVGFREMMIIFTDDYLWHEAENGNRTPLFRQLLRLGVLESFEVVGFVTLIALMVSF